MEYTINQAVVFTKPLHHLGLSLTPEQLDRQARSFLEEKGFKVVFTQKVTGTELAERDVIRQHYLMYSRASYGDAAPADEGKATFESAFGKSWDAEVEAGRIMGNPQLLETKGITAQELYLLWKKRFTGGQTQKIQNGVTLAWLDELDCYCINAFYPVLAEIFYNPATELAYYVLEFDPAQVSWKQFRTEILGSTDAGKADPESFRGRLYAEYPVEFPGRDNFVHGSAGPVEGLVERIIHEPGFDMETNPVGRYLAGRGISLEAFKSWKASQSISRLGDLFDRTEENDTTEALAVLDGIRF
jgi:hypothetical protein